MKASKKTAELNNNQNSWNASFNVTKGHLMLTLIPSSKREKLQFYFSFILMKFNSSSRLVHWIIYSLVKPNENLMLKMSLYSPFDWIREKKRFSKKTKLLFEKNQEISQFSVKLSIKLSVDFLVKFLFFISFSWLNDAKFWSTLTIWWVEE